MQTLYYYSFKFSEHLLHVTHCVGGSRHSSEQNKLPPGVYLLWQERDNELTNNYIRRYLRIVSATQRMKSERCTKATGWQGRLLQGGYVKLTPNDINIGIKSNFKRKSCKGLPRQEPMWSLYCICVFTCLSPPLICNFHDRRGHVYFI